VTVGKDPTNRKGIATATLKAPLLVEISNDDAIVTATGSVKGITTDGRTTVTVRVVINAKGKHYWTMLTDHPTNSKEEATRYCHAFGGGKPASSQDLKSFKDADADFKNMYVTGEFGNLGYNLTDLWNKDVGDFHSDAEPVG